jgi:hypothetical protein
MVIWNIKILKFRTENSKWYIQDRTVISVKLQSNSMFSKADFGDDIIVVLIARIGAVSF